METNTPHVGLAVQYVSHEGKSAAQITAVHEDGTVNLAVFENGSTKVGVRTGVHRDGCGPEHEACYKPIPQMTGEAPPRPEFRGARVTTAFPLEFVAGGIDTDYFHGRSKAIADALCRKLSRDPQVRGRYAVLEWDFDDPHEAREFAQVGVSKIKDHPWAVTDLASGNTQRLGKEDALEGDVLDAAEERRRRREDGLPRDAAQDLIDDSEDAREPDPTENTVQSAQDRVAQQMADEAAAYEEEERQRALENERDETDVARAQAGVAPSGGRVG